jgi:hypothetical protein
VRLVDAARIFGQIVTRERVGAGAGASADLLVFANAALAFALFRIAERAEKIRVLVNIGALSKFMAAPGTNSFAVG